MGSFVEVFKKRGNISFTGMRDTAMSLLPKDKVLLDKWYGELERGTEILDDDNHLNVYLRSYGKMHMAKMNEAFSRFQKLSEICKQDIEVYDWGCGQGLATICFLDYLKKLNISISRIKSITLVEPSKPAISRGRDVIKCYGESLDVRCVNKVFDNLTDADFPENSNCKIHLFSNILDVDSFDLACFIQLFQRVFSGINYFVSVGPYYTNSRRVDEFLVATNPDEIYAVFNKDKGTWLNEWTISLRVFVKNFTKVEELQDIRKRIEEAHKNDQFFAGYVLDAVEEEYSKSDVAHESETLYNALSVFDVKSNKTLDNLQDTPSRAAVLANIISRGLPTKAPLFLEEHFSNFFKISEKKQTNSNIRYSSTHTFNKRDVWEALHVIDPRFNTEFYNGDILESQFEKNFIESYLQGSNKYLIQLLEPQRPLSTIIDINKSGFGKEQRVDFSLEIPYDDSQSGYIFEIDGEPYHTGLKQKIKDQRRDQFSVASGWNPRRLNSITDTAFITEWERNSSTSRYLATIRANAQKTISGKWKDTLQVVLSPLAVARIERMLVQAILSGALDTKKDTWNIAVIERDVPCAALAIEDFKELFGKLSQLDGSDEKLPDIRLSIISTNEFKDSPLHLGHKVLTEAKRIPCDMCIDISMLLRDNIDALPIGVEADTVYIIRTSHYKKKDRCICSADNIVYPPLVKKDSAGVYTNIPERESVLTYFLQNIFRKPGFRHGQLPILSRALSDKTTIGLLPTGGGKSLTYQLSSLLQPGVTIVVDPLVSLMVDQVRGLRDIRIDVCSCVHSGMDVNEKNNQLNMLQNGSLQFMLLSPERFMMENFRSSLFTMSSKNNVYFSYGVIDEVHCVSEWGHDFRTSYLHLGRNMIEYMQTKSKRPLSIIGLTATASFDVLADVERELTLGNRLAIDSETIVRPDSDTRPELTYRIVEVDADYDSLRTTYDHRILDVDSDRALQEKVADAKRSKLFSLLDEIPFDLETINKGNELSPCKIDELSTDNFYGCDVNGKYPNAGIVFCPHAHGSFGVEESRYGNHPGVAMALQENKSNILHVGTFVGGDRPSGDMSLFNGNEQNLMVATKAFGMGIDKPNIRYTVHMNHPSSIESYVQEAGRGGRDKKHAISYILYDPTEFVHLTIDKVSDIRKLMGTENDPAWLENYRNKYILFSDFDALCIDNGCSHSDAHAICDIIRANGFVETVDKNIDLWFHNNSFRGLYKEKVILAEMTDRILNVKPTVLTEVQSKLREVCGNEDLVLKTNTTNNSIKIVSEEDSSEQYGFMYLDGLRPSTRYISPRFSEVLCSRIMGNLRTILSTYDDHSADGLSRPLDGSEDNTTEGIYSAMKKADSDGYVYVTVSWRNQIIQDFGEFENAIKQEVTNIATSQQWQDIDSANGELRLNKIESFEELLSRIAFLAQDSRWLRNHGNTEIYRKLNRVFCSKRDKDDTDKAIYRMCCIGLVEDVTIDYLSETYELKVRNRTNEEFKQNMLDFFCKYYSLEQAEEKVAEIETQRGRNYLDKCLGYLTGFVYANLEKKRYRAIEDMRIACEDSLSRGKNGSAWLKEFIHLYFNSKYARLDYRIGNEQYSLSEDSNRDNSFALVEKYIDVLSKDPSGSEIENAKHLYGATLLCLRAHPDNAALQLLLTFCIAFLGGSEENEALKTDAWKGFSEGFMSLYHSKGSSVLEQVDVYIDHLTKKVQSHPEDVFIKDNIVNNGKDAIMLFIHNEELTKIRDKYLKK